MSADYSSDRDQSKSQNEKSGRRAARTRKKKARSENTVEVIDRHLLETITMTINGKPQRVAVLAAIVFQLVQKELGGDAKAGRVLLKYQSLARRVADQQVELEFVDSDPALSSGPELPDERRD